MTIYIYPTDTLWGIGCNIFDKNSVAAIATIKHTDANKPVSILFNRVSEVQAYFNLAMSTEWLKEFFKYESTLLIPKKLASKEIPNWIVGESLFVGVRCLSNKAVDKIIATENAPIVTTSLNLSGDAPIFEKEKARRFFEQNCPSAQFLDEEINPSGHPSSIVCLGESIDFIRRGFFERELEKHLELLPT